MTSVENQTIPRSACSGPAGWTPIASWVNTAAFASVNASGVTFVSGEVRETFPGPRASYRYCGVQW